MSEDMIFGVEFPRSKIDFDFAMHTMQDFYSNYERGLFTDPHRLFFNAIIYITHGCGKHYVDHQVCHIKPGTILFISKYQAHRFEYNPGIRGYIIPFCDNILFYGNDDPYKSRIRSAFEDINFLHEKEQTCSFFFEQLWLEYKNLHSNLGEEVIRNSLRTLILKTLVRQHQSSFESNSHAHYSSDYCKFHDLIKTHYVYTRTVEKYANMMGVTTKKLNQIAKENTGKTGKELIDSYAVLESKRLLAYSQDPIASIAQKLGFSEPTNLTKFFKKHSGLTPKEFRNLCLFHNSK